MLTGDAQLVDRARTLSLHGMTRNAWNRYGTEGTWFYDVVCPGFKCNMTDLQASLGLVQLSRLESLQHRRAEIFARYNAAFEPVSSLQIPVCRADVQPARHLYVLRLCDGAARGGRDALIAELKVRGICTSVHFIPVHLHTYYRQKYGYQPEDFPVTLDNYRRMLSLPLSPALTDDEVSRVISAVRQITAEGPNKLAA